MTNKTKQTRNCRRSSRSRSAFLPIDRLQFNSIESSQNATWSTDGKHYCACIVWPLISCLATDCCLAQRGHRCLAREAAITFQHLSMSGNRRDSGQHSWTKGYGQVDCEREGRSANHQWWSYNSEIVGHCTPCCAYTCWYRQGSGCWSWRWNH